MEKIITLEKERKERSISNCLSFDTKVKLNISLSNTKFFEKAVSEITKKVFIKKILTESADDILVASIQNMIGNFKIRIEYVEEKNIIDLIGRVQLKYTAGAERQNIKRIEEYTQELVPIRCIVTDKNDNMFEFYSLLRGHIGSKVERYTFPLNRTSYNIVDFSRKISQLYIFNEAINYFEKNEYVCIDTLKKFTDINNINKGYNYLKQFLEFANTIIEGKKETLLNLKTYYLIRQNGLSRITNYATEIIGALFKEMAIDNQDIAIQEEQLTELNSDYAKSFEIKKNINKETENAMKSSLFNKHFKETEFDNETDLVKMNQLEDEFRDTLNYLNSSETIIDFMNNVTLRFRYLGHHRASGLYFPSYKTICVDVRDPSSFLHEFMHMVDFHGEVTRKYKLSSQYDYRKIKECYINNLDNIVSDMSDDSSFKSKYYGKTKFNKNYYCNGAEIFARCGEIYLKRILKIDNSLIGELSDNKPEYMVSKELENMIKEYYSQIFEIDNVKIEKSAAPMKIPNKILVTTDIATKVTASGQLSFL